MYRHPIDYSDQEDPSMAVAEERTSDTLDERTSVELRLSSLNA